MPQTEDVPFSTFAVDVIVPVRAWGNFFWFGDE